MKAFEISPEQTASVIAGLIAEELGAHFGRHVDSMTAARWSAQTPLLDAGVGFSSEERQACAQRVLRFFGVDQAPPDFAAGEKIGDWAAAVSTTLRARQQRFAFSAAGDGAAEFIHAADAFYVDSACVANLLYGRRRILSLVAPHGLIGFALTVLAPNLLQIPSIDARALTPEELTKSLAFGDALIATPSLWRYAVQGGVAAPDNAMAVFFGEPMASGLAADMRQAGFGAQRELYGSTETGLIGWRDSPSEPFVLFDHWKRAGDMLNRTAPNGEESQLAPMDTLVWEAERRFRLAGRRDGAVQIGGVNVFPARIAERIREHPAVALCVIDVSRHAGGADRLIANIELVNGGAPGESTARSIDSWCRSKLRPQERPRVFNFKPAAGA